eukprot:1383736-Amorphochlora_amoeboformis.AAC.1
MHPPRLHNLPPTGISRSATPAVLPTLRYHHTPLLNSPQDVSYVSSNVMNAEKVILMKRSFQTEEERAERGREKWRKEERLTLRFIKKETDMERQRLSDFAADRRQSSGLEGEPVRVSVEGVGLIAVGKNSDHR